MRALLQVAAEEAKHIHLFRRFSAEFERGFGFSCGKVGPPREIARAVLSHHPLGVALAILQIEWMTQAHYLESVKDDQDLAPQFKSLLRHHWMEEAQHAKIDTIIIDTLADACTPEEIDRAVDDYGKIGALLDAGLTTQAEYDDDSFVRRSGRTFTADEREALRAAQRQDGVTLIADVWRPSREGRFPTLVYRTPYGRGRDLTEESIFRKALARGNAVVSQDVRGRYDSGGEFNPYSQDRHDGYDTIEWAARQPWSTGEIGTFGLSYPGAVQWLAAIAAAAPEGDGARHDLLDAAQLHLVGRSLRRLVDRLGVVRHLAGCQDAQEPRGAADPQGGRDRVGVNAGPDAAHPAPECDDRTARHRAVVLPMAVSPGPIRPLEETAAWRQYFLKTGSPSASALSKARRVNAFFRAQGSSTR